MRLLALVALAACHHGPPAPPPAPSDTVMYEELTLAGCLARSDGGVAAVAAEHRSPNPPWLQCLYNGGTIAGCGVPCAH